MQLKCSHLYFATSCPGQSRCVAVNHSWLSLYPVSLRSRGVVVNLAVECVALGWSELKSWCGRSLPAELPSTIYVCVCMCVCCPYWQCLCVDALYVFIAFDPSLCNI